MLNGTVDGFSKIASQYGEFVALAVVMLAFFSGFVTWVIRRLFKWLDAEQQQLAKERNRLLEMLEKLIKGQ